MLANLSVPLLGAVDTAVIGHLEYPYFLGAVAIGATIIQFVYWGFGFLRMGTTGLTAQAYGANNFTEVRQIFQTSAILGITIGLLLWVLQYPIITLSIDLFEASEEVENLALIYFNIRIWSAPAVLINYCLIGWFIGTQNSRTAFIIQIWMNLVNIILDLIFVISFNWGVEGVASATVISEITAALLGIYLYLKRIKKISGTRRLSKQLLTKNLKRILTINFNIFIRTFCLIFAFAYFTAKAAKYGDIYLAANVVLLQFLHFLSFGLDGFAQTAESLVGAALGAKNKCSYKSAVKITTVWAICISAAYTLTYIIFSHEIIDMLTSLPSVRIVAKEFVIWLIVLPSIAVWPYMLDGIFIGATRSIEMRNSMILSLIVFILSVIILEFYYGYQGLWIALIIFMAMRGVTLTIKYHLIEKN
jgi:MATE family multidrug resistance protein